MSTIKDVAGRAGVSVATVSRFLNNNGYVSEKSSKKISEAIDELNYTPNEIARSLYNKSSKLIGLLIPQIDNPFFSNIIKGVESICNERGFHLIISNISNLDDEDRYLDSFMKNQVAGIISSIGSSKKYDHIKCPIVGVDRARDNFEYAVYFDEINGGRLSACAILEGGCKRVLVNVGPKEIDVAKYRFQGIKDIFDENNIDYEIYYSSGYGYDSAMEFVEYLKDKYMDYDSIIACNDLHALCATLFLERENVSVPNDIQIIGYDDIIFSKVSNPKIATIRHDACYLGKIAATMLIDLIEKKEIENNKIQLDTFLIKNESLRIESD